MDVIIQLGFSLNEFEIDDGHIGHLFHSEDCLYLCHKKTEFNMMVFMPEDDKPNFFGSYTGYEKELCSGGDPDNYPELIFPPENNYGLDNYCNIEELLNIYLKDFLKQIRLYELSKRLN